MTLTRVGFLAGDQEWKRVGEALLTISGLVFVELQMASSIEEPPGFCSASFQTLSGGNPPGVRLEGRASMVMGLQELAYLGPSFFGQRN